jgi:hypothetical protein
MSTDNKYLNAVYKYHKCIFSPATAKKENKIARTRPAGNPAKNLYTSTLHDFWNKGKSKLKPLEKEHEIRQILVLVNIYLYFSIQTHNLRVICVYRY